MNILVTGVSGGFGTAIADDLLARGHAVIGTARNPQSASYPIFPLDISNDQSIAELANRITQPIEVLINNAGIATITPEAGRGEASLDDLSREEFAKIFNVNAIGTFMLTRALLPQLRRGSGKLIVNISSNLGSIAANNGGRYAYRASKAALNMITKTFSVDLAAEGFVCVAWSPGWVKTRMGGSEAPLTPEESAMSLCEFLPKFDKNFNGKFVARADEILDW